MWQIPCKMTNSSSKPLQTLGKWYQPRNPKNNPKPAQKKTYNYFTLFFLCFLINQTMLKPTYFYLHHHLVLLILCGFNIVKGSWEESSEVRMTCTCNNTLNEEWCETWHHIRIHSMKGGVRLWWETWNHIRIHSMKGGVRLWCQTWHHIRISAMTGGVRLWCETWHHITIRSCNGCMIVVIWCCHVRRYVQVCNGMLRNAL